MVKNLIGWLCLGVFLVACEQEDIHYNTGESDTYRFSIPVSLASDLRIQEGTDYVPMVTKAGGTIRTNIDVTCRCLVLKKIESKWYVEDLLWINLDKSGDLSKAPEEPSDGTSDNLIDAIGTIDLTLRPGDYHILVVANPRGVKWNPDLIPGYMVKDEEEASENQIPYAFTYWMLPLPWDEREEFCSLLKEIFTGTYQFTITKTGDLHSDPIHENDKLKLTRKVSRFRILLKEVPSSKGFIFENTPHFVFTKLRTTPATPFCDGIDCWGDAYYNLEQPRYELPLYISTPGSKGSVVNGVSYQLVLYSNSTFRGVFVFTDEKKTGGVPYEISIENFTSSAIGNTYYYDGTITGHSLYPNSIDGVVFQTTDEYIQVSEQRKSVKVEKVPNENAANLFGPFYEVNQP